MFPPLIQPISFLWQNCEKYTQSLLSYSQALKDSQRSQLTEVASLAGRTQTAEKLLNSLKFASAQAWSKTEALLADEVQRHGINPPHIDPWQIARESHQLYEKVLTVYPEGNTPQSQT